MLRVAAVCEHMRLPYFVTGSVASMAWGEPRHTQDVDVVVELPSWRVREFCAQFPEPEFYVSVEAALEAVSGTSQFNIIEPANGVKADIIAFRGRPHDEACLSRARRIEMSGTGTVMVSSPEDVILHKLLFFREGGSEKHLRDIASILKISGSRLDGRYLDDWALRLGVVADWQAIKSELRMP